MTDDLTTHNPEVRKVKRALFVLLAVAAFPVAARAQASGNVGYSQAGGQARAEAAERAKRSVSKDDAPPTPTSMFVDASVLMNVRADEHVAVFALQHECATVPECNQKMDATVASFTRALGGLGVRPADTFVDFAAQNKIYAFRLAGDVAKEELVGFELKKNVSVRYGDRDLLDRLIIAASRSNIFDLVKVDYVVRDTAAVQERLMEEAARVVERKAARYMKLFNVRLLAPAQVYAERPSVYYPAEMYDSYTAFESEGISQSFDNDKYTVQRARKSRTFFFNALTADGFDTVVNPVVIEPVVQFTLYLKVKYEVEQPKR
ncbi:MAG: SIMPL domain-containing protein [Acidobacteriota bacterium]|nr:SIMPL domain-containing protein [Acidobacteriota bacterium]